MTQFCELVHYYWGHHQLRGSVALFGTAIINCRTVWQFSYCLNERQNNNSFNNNFLSLSLARLSRVCMCVCVVPRKTGQLLFKLLFQSLDDGVERSGNGSGQLCSCAVAVGPLPAAQRRINIGDCADCANCVTLCNVVVSVGPNSRHTQSWLMIDTWNEPAFCGRLLLQLLSPVGRKQRTLCVYRANEWKIKVIVHCLLISQLHLISLSVSRVREILILMCDTHKSVLDSVSVEL